MEKRTHIEARILRLEALARIITAEKMALLDDPLGDKLPGWLWGRCQPLAMAVRALIQNTAPAEFAAYQLAATVETPSRQ